MKVEKIKFKSAGYKLTGEIDLPNEFTGKFPVIILFHGLTNSKEDCPLINETSEALVREGFIAFRFDFYGSGESPGEMRDKKWDVLEQNTKDAIEFIAKDSRVDSKRIGLWGRSVGGTLVYSLPPNKRIKARVVASASVTFEKAMKERFEGLRKKELKLEKKGKKLPGTKVYKGPFEFRRAWWKSLDGLDERIFKNLKKLDRTLVLGTTIDQKVPISNVCRAMNNLKRPKRIWIFKADHSYKGVEGEVVKETLDWFNKYLK